MSTVYGDSNFYVLYRTYWPVNHELYRTGYWVQYQPLLCCFTDKWFFVVNIGRFGIGYQCFGSLFIWCGSELSADCGSASRGLFLNADPFQDLDKRKILFFSKHSYNQRQSTGTIMVSAFKESFIFSVGILVFTLKRTPRSAIWIQYRTGSTEFKRNSFLLYFCIGLPHYYTSRMSICYISIFSWPLVRIIDMVIWLIST
jgi:hypothetical protein